PSTKTAQDYSVRGFGLAVGLGMLDRRETLLGIDRDEEFAESLVRKLCPIVRDHDLWDPKSSKYVSFEETEYVERCYVCKWFSFHPLGKIIDSHY
ncbi:hypothetical protein A2U01_0037466, partial [Trifolium medium]|nr:hypothetical protein [Trifolium medium]